MTVETLLTSPIPSGVNRVEKFVESEWYDGPILNIKTYDKIHYLGLVGQSGVKHKALAVLDVGRHDARGGVLEALDDGRLTSTWE